METKRTMFSTRKARMAKSRTEMSGWLWRSSTSAKTTSRATPAAIAPMAVALPQPHSWVCWIPNTVSPTPMQTRTRPGTSTRAGRVSVLGRAMAMSTSATMATGMLTQKMARQVHWLRTPPRIGPMAVNPPATPKKMAMARPRSFTGNAPTTIATAAGYMIAPPRPWSTRNDTIQASAPEPAGVRPHIVDAPANTTMPMTTILECPMVSASRPPKAKKAASDSR